MALPSTLHSIMHAGGTMYCKSCTTRYFSVSVIAGPNTCGLMNVALFMQHETAGSHSLSMV